QAWVAVPELWSTARERRREALARDAVHSAYRSTHVRTRLQIGSGLACRHLPPFVEQMFYSVFDSASRRRDRPCTSSETSSSARPGGRPYLVGGPCQPGRLGDLHRARHVHD